MLIYSIRDGFFLYWMKGVLDGIAGIKYAYKTRQVLRKETMEIIKRIDMERPKLRKLIKDKLFRKGVRL